MLEAEIVLTYSSENEAKTISNAISPDNLEAPVGLFIETKALGCSVVTTIKYDGENIATFLSTIDDLLSCASTAEKTLSAISKLT